jgi:hypothetical protein
MGDKIKLQAMRQLARPIEKVEPNSEGNRAERRAAKKSKKKSAT